MSHLALTRRSLPIWLFLLLAALFAPAAGGLLPGLMLVSPAQAETYDPFTVRGLDVDITAANAGIARDQALQQGQRQGADIVLRRFTTAADWPRLPKLTDLQLQGLVLDVGIDQEKRSGVRYLASLSVRFKAEPVRALLRGAGIPYVEWRGRPLAVLPVLHSAEGEPLLWDGVNPWRDAWKSPAAQGLVPMLVPVAPSSPDPALTPALIEQAQPETLDALARRYGTNDLLVMIAALVQSGPQVQRLDVSALAAGPLAGGLTGLRSYTPQPGETADQLMRRAVADFARSAEDTYKTPGNLLQFDRNGTLSVLVPLQNGLEDWLSLRDRLTRIGAIRSYEIAALSRSEASLLLHYVGDPQQIQTACAQMGLGLTWVQDHWILRVTALPQR